MGIIFAIIFVALAVVTLVVYNGTPHGGPTTTCGPIDVFGHTTTLHVDCRYLSAGEVVVAAAFFLLAVLSALAARPRA